MQFDCGISFAQELPNTHDCAAGPDTGDKGIWSNRMKIKLPPDLRPGSFLVRFDVCLVGELSGQKHVRLFFGQRFSHANTADKSTLVAAHRNDFRPEALN